MLCRHHVRRPRAAGQSWTPPQLCRAYNYPTGLIGPDVTIGVIELGGGYKTADVYAAFDSWGLPRPKLVDVLLKGADSSPGQDADIEVLLDIQIAAAVYSYCTGRRAVVRTYFAPNTDAGFAAAVQKAVDDGCAVVSISWGAAEEQWPAASRAQMDAVCKGARAKGVAVFAASGDNLSDDGVGDGKPHVDYPAACPDVIGCGGTRKTPAGETVWNDGGGGGTGGGFSRYYARPGWQVGAPSGAGRMVPDVAANADPATGWVVWADGAPTVVGGTSAVAPCLAGLFAAYASANGGRPLPDVLPLIYQHTAKFLDVTEGNNGQYRAQTGPDPCTGLGVPDGAALMPVIIAPPATQPPPPPPSGPPAGGPPPGGSMQIPSLRVNLVGTSIHIGDTVPVALSPAGLVGDQNDRPHDRADPCVYPLPGADLMSCCAAPSGSGGGVAHARWLAAKAAHPHLELLDARFSWLPAIPPEVLDTLKQIALQQAQVVAQVLKEDLLPLLIGSKTWYDVLRDVILAVGRSVAGLVG